MSLLYPHLSESLTISGVSSLRGGRFHLPMAMFLGGHVSPTTTQLAEGYTDEALRSNYDNHR